MTLAPPPIRFTAEDLLSLPDNNTMEFVHGEILEKPVSDISSRAEARITFLFLQFMEANPVGVVYPQSMGYQCFQAITEDPNRVRKPDVSVILMDRHRSLPSKDPGYMPIPPDLAVEVLSKNDVIVEMSEKVLEYRRAGFPLVWVVDPYLKTVSVYTGSGKAAIFTEGDEIEAPQALPGFRCKVDAFFPRD